MYRNLPQDIRPMGTNNLNQLVHHHLGSASFDVVAQVQANLPWLHDLYNKLGLISALAANSESITRLGQHTQTLYVIAQSMPALKEIYCKLDLLESISGNLCKSTKINEELNDKLTILLGIISVKDIDNLIARYDEVEAKLAEAETLLKTINQNKLDIQSLNKISVHLQASEAVTLAEQSLSQEDKLNASLLVQESIKLGNDESVNQNRLGKL